MALLAVSNALKPSSPVTSGSLFWQIHSKKAIISQRNGSLRLILAFFLTGSPNFTIKSPKLSTLFS